MIFPLAPQSPFQSSVKNQNAEKAWNPNLRSKTAIRISNTRYFIDPSIAAAALGLGPQDLNVMRWFICAMVPTD